MKIHITGAEIENVDGTYHIRYKDEVVAEVRDRWECIAKCLNRHQLEDMLKHKKTENMYNKLMT